MPFPVLVEQFLENLRWNIQLLVGDEDRMFYRLQSEPDSYFRDLACDEAEEAGLKSAQVGEGSERCVIIYKDGWSPPEVLEAEKYSKALEEEARADQLRTERLLQAKLQQVSKPSSAAPAPPPASAAKVVPLFRVKDKRTIEEVQADIQRKKQARGVGFSEGAE